jgi:hypothetical protein
VQTTAIFAINFENCSRVVGQAGSLSIWNDGQPRVLHGAERGAATESFCLFSITFENFHTLKRLTLLTFTNYYDILH